MLDSIRKSVADQVGGLLWGTDDETAAANGQSVDGTTYPDNNVGARSSLTC